MDRGVEPSRHGDVDPAPLAHIEGSNRVASQQGSGSEASEDSDSLTWGAGRGGHGAKRQVVGADEEGFRSGSEAMKEGEEGYRGGQDEADEDIHARWAGRRRRQRGVT